MAFEATFESRCPACDEMIREGNKVVLNVDEEWIHEDCADADWPYPDDPPDPL